MSVTSLTEHFVPFHAVAAVGFGQNVFIGDRRPKAWPSGSRIKLRIGFEQIVIATDALVDALFVIVPILTGESPLGSFTTGNLVLLALEHLFPFSVRFNDLVAHKESFLRNGIELDLSPSRRFDL